MRSGIEGVEFRFALTEDVPAILSLIHELAEYERMTDRVSVTQDEFCRWVFQERAAEVIMVEKEGTAIGYAQFFRSFSTFLGRPGLYLEDIYVRSEHRRLGIGGALMRTLAGLALERGWGRMEWACLDWNAASIDFYTKKLGAIPLSEWTTYRLEGDRLTSAAKE